MNPFLKVIVIGIISVGIALIFQSCRKEPTVPSITTAGVTGITPTTAESGGNVTGDGGSGIVRRGVCWSISQNPTTSSSKTSDGTGTGTFTSFLTGLIENTKYYVRAYAANSEGTSYGNEISFTTSTVQLATVKTRAVDPITSTYAVSGGTVSADGGGSITARGVCWNTSENPTTALSTKTMDGSGIGTFTSIITGLTANTKYHVRAYATNNAGISYGDVVTFITPTIVLPTVTTAPSSATSITTAISGGNVTSDGGGTVAEKGVCWSITSKPKIELGTKTVDGVGTGVFTSNITGLSPLTTYHVRAYATNSAGTNYGEELTFTTPAHDCTGKIIIDPFNSPDINGSAFNVLRTRDERDAYIQAKLYEDWVNTMPYSASYPVWVCAMYAEQLMTNSRDWGEEIRLDNDYFSFHFYDDRLSNWYKGRNIDSIKLNRGTLVDMGKLGLPMSIIVLGDTVVPFGHTMNWILTGDDITKWDDINLIEPQLDEVNVPVGNWDIPFNCSNVELYYYYSTNGINGNYLRWIILEKFSIRNGIPILTWVNEDPCFSIKMLREN